MGTAPQRGFAEGLACIQNSHCFHECDVLHFAIYVPYDKANHQGLHNAESAEFCQVSGMMCTRASCGTRIAGTPLLRTTGDPMTVESRAFLKGDDGGEGNAPK